MQHQRRERVLRATSTTGRAARKMLVMAKDVSATGTESRVPSEEKEPEETQSVSKKVA
jgi:hypothetical protein